MDFYEAIQKRRTVRDFSDKPVPAEALERILNAGLQAPSNNHLREWEFVVLHEQKDKENALHCVAEWATAQAENRNIDSPVTPAQKMYAYAMPRQYTMLLNCPYVILPFFKGGAGPFHATSFNKLNAFASIWCVIENILLAATAEGLACSMRIPVGEEHEQVAKAVHAPEGYLMPCYIGLGYPSDTSPSLEQPTYTAKQKMHFGTW